MSEHKLQHEMEEVIHEVEEVIHEVEEVIHDVYVGLSEEELISHSHHKRLEHWILILRNLPRLLFLPSPMLRAKSSALIWVRPIPAWLSGKADNRTSLPVGKVSDLPPLW